MSTPLHDEQWCPGKWVHFLMFAKMSLCLSATTQENVTHVRMTHVCIRSLLLSYVAWIRGSVTWTTTIHSITTMATIDLRPYSGKLSREKSFVNFAVLWLFAKDFSAKFGGVASFGTPQMSNLWKFSPENRIFHFVSSFFTSARSDFTFTPKMHKASTGFNAHWSKYTVSLPGCLIDVVSSQSAPILKRHRLRSSLPLKMVV